MRPPGTASYPLYHAVFVDEFNYFLLNEHTTLTKKIIWIYIYIYIAHIPLLGYYPPAYIFLYSLSFEPLHLLEHHIMLSPLISSI